MLYLFGRLALSDSLDYHENYHDDDFRPATHNERSSPPEPDARTAADRQLRRASHLSQADRASAGCPNN
ncbi:hypothetical protein GCM10023172_32160 [Hymenobacter ginsengisoli]|uniref:Uncharacterized protein n=1 Tax=Hymenobacter ginsengisoli TaxID=1051626 RepID=A0ABP8QKE1_9BACT|nr:MULTISPECIES: hypothetical protein [unclassified Hymenobacter]MBO2031245.1 hypothetical protein [Hymenobacter sp. BT559]